MIIKNITELIGNTPLIKISESVHGIPNLDLYCKLEFMNAFGSIKDRIGLNMLKPHLTECKNKNKTILEASSGNTAKALALLASINNLKFKTISNRIKTHEMKELLLLFNSEIEELPGISECPDPNNPDDYMAVDKRLADENPDKIFYTDQYFNKKNPEAHMRTGEEIADDLKKVDYFFGFLGTAGSSSGIGSVLKSKRKSRVIGIVAKSGNYVPGGRTLDEMWEVGFYDKNFYDDIIAGTTDEAIEGMLTLVRKVGLLCGPTSGLSYQKLIEYFENNPLKQKTSAVFVACDRIEPYLSYIEKYAPDLIGKEESKNIFNNIDDLDIENSKDITAKSLKKIIDKVTIIDIRSSQAFQMFHLPNSINIPESDLEIFFEKNIPFSNNRKLIVVCSKGIKSKKLVAILTKNGFDSASLKNGVYSWQLSD
jgi:cysteine synthase B